MSDIHQHRRVAESFGAGAEQYDRARPPYPEAAIERIVAARADVRHRRGRRDLALGRPDGRRRPSGETSP
ncbi:hypothetical protein ACQP2F_34425 [Actinoplanes sp. CA-030573]|uniref:hypothetical protein n=1 Tax=Actinoplanes sp. CA-030573 TaxID=3239898 RepID=UPI003D8BA732